MVGARGEGILQVGDGEVRVLFTNRALAEAERATGKTILEIARGAESGNLGIGDVAQLLHVGMEHARRESRAGGRSYTINDAWQVLDMLGFGAVAAAVFEAIAAVLAFGVDTGQEDEENPPA